MGGKLLHIWNLPEKRVPRAEFDRIIVEVLEVLRGHYPEHRIEPLKFFSEKQDFGDLDMAFESKSGWNIDWKSKIEELFGFNPHKNGDCVSFPYEGFQVDILLFSSEVFDIAQVYYAYESGNFMGRVADQMGLSYGHKGLYLQVPLRYFGAELPEHEYKDILVQRDPEEIFKLLGFDYERFQRGFRNFEEMSSWVADSVYFAPEVFAFDALNSINRTRNRKRPVYAKFVEWCERQPARHLLPSKEAVRNHLIAKYRSVEHSIESVREEILRNEARRRKFNGNLVKILCEISDGPALGKFIVDFKKRFANFDEWLDANSAESVKAEILKYK